MNPSTGFLCNRYYNLVACDLVVVIFRVSIAVKRHHDHGQLLSGKTFIWGFLTGTEVQFTVIMAGSRWHVGRHGAGEKTKVLHLDQKVAGRERESLA